MFTGIIERQAEIIKIKPEKGNLRFTCQTPLASELQIDQSLAHNGVCLTVVQVNPQANSYEVVAIEETLKCSNLSSLQVGNLINLERCLKVGDRLDGHIVQGHIDTIATCNAIENLAGSWKFTFQLLQKSDTHLIEKGSIAINGVSLTLINCSSDTFSVAIIPYTFTHTHFSNLKISDKVNIEFDMFGKYIQKHMAKYASTQT